MSAGLNQFLNQEMYSDCSITVEDDVFQAHQVILAASSDFFQTRFTTKLTNQSNVKLPWITSEVMKVILQFMYNSKCDLTDDNVLDVFVAADFLLMPTLLDLAEQKIIQNLDPMNCISIYSFSKIYSSITLQQASRMYLTRNIGKVIEEAPEEFESMELDDLILVLSSDFLNVTSEEKTWEAILQWVENAPEERQHYFPSLLKTVRLGLLSPEYFTGRIRTHPAISENEECQPIISEAFKVLFDFEIINLLSLGRFRIPNDIVFTIGGWTAKNVTSCIEAYDIRADHWITMDPTGPRAYHGTVVVGDEIFVIGGYNGFQHFNTCRCFNIVDRSWRAIAPMHFKRCYVSVTFCKGYIYAMGGYNGQHRLNTAERYDIVHNQWTMIGNMRSVRSDAAATTLNEKIYLIGGYNGHNCLSSAEVYDPDTNKWSWIPPMTFRRSGVSSTISRNCIYALGGFNGQSRHSSVEKYDPETRIWTKIPDMIQSRSNFAAVAIEDLILVMGGYDGRSTTAFVEFYCPVRDFWWAASPLNMARSALSGCVAMNFRNIESYSYQNQLETD